MTYFTPKYESKIRADARALCNKDRDDWSFIHSLLFEWCSVCKMEHVSGPDGFVQGVFDLNAGAEFLEISLNERSAFLNVRTFAQAFGATG